MIKKLKGIVLATLVSFSVVFSSCVLVTPETEAQQQAVDNVCKSLVAQGVYSSLKKDPEKMYKVWDTTLISLNVLYKSVDLTPAEISNEIVKEVAAKTNTDYSFLVEALLQQVFAKKQIAWSDKIDKEQAKHLLTIITEAIEMGIGRYEEANAEASGAALPEDMPNNPYEKS